jgi:hypothetical protein
MRLEVQLPDIGSNLPEIARNTHERGDVVVRSNTTVGLAVVGLTLDYISPLSPAHLSEKMAVGDEIVEVDACAVSESSFLTYVLGDDTPGSLCNIKVSPSLHPILSSSLNLPLYRMATPQKLELRKKFSISCKCQ